MTRTYFAFFIVYILGILLQIFKCIANGHSIVESLITYSIVYFLIGLLTLKILNSKKNDSNKK